MDIGGIIGGAAKGLKYVVATIRIMEDGVIHQDEQKEHDARVVLLAWTHEVDEVEKNPFAALGDPFKGSRHQAQELIKKYGGK